MTEEDIRIKAYELWQAAGQPDGQSSMNVFWYEAERLLLAQAASKEQAPPNEESALSDLEQTERVVPFRKSAR
jgi:DUF2934 family protein